MAALIDDVKVKSNLTATTAPTINDDSTRGYSVFSPWVDVSEDRVYFAAAVPVGAAVWREVTAGVSSDGANNQVLTDDGNGGLVSESGLIFDGTNLAINNTTPNALLDVRGAVGAAGIVELSTAETTVVDGNELGRINFRAPDEAAGGDAILVGAAIHAEAEATFSASVNSTAIVFSMGESGTATEKMRLTAAGFLGIGTSNPTGVLHFVDSAVGIAAQAAADDLIIERSGSGGMTILSSTTGSGHFFFGDNQDNDIGRLSYRHATDSFLFRTNADDRVVIDSSGNLGVGNLTSLGARVSIGAEASAVGLNIDLNVTPGIGFTVTDSSSVVLFAVESDGETTTEFDSVFNTTEGGTARLTRRSIRELHTLTLGATSDTTTISVPTGARILGVSMNVNTAVTNDGDNTWKADWITGSTQVIAAAGTTAAQDTKVDSMHPIYELAAATAEIRFIPQSGNFTAGVIEIVAYFETLTSLANV